MTTTGRPDTSSRRRVAATIVLEVILTIALSFLLLTGWQGLLSGVVVDAFAEAAYLLFFFNDIAMAAWIVVLVVIAVRTKAVPSVGVSFLAALIGVALNVIVVTTIGLVQQGWFAFYVLFAIEAGVVFLIAVVIVVPLVQRLRKPPSVRVPGS